MADESIGGVTVSIRGDASQLNQDFQAAQQQAQQAGEKIAQAFAVPVSAVNDLGSAAKLAGATISEALLSPVPSADALKAAIAEVKVAEEQLASLRAQVVQAGSLGGPHPSLVQEPSPGALAALDQYQQKLVAAQQAVVSIQEAQAAAAAASEAAARIMIAAAGEVESATGSQGAQLAVLQGQYREVSGAIRQSVTLIAQTEAAAGAEIRQGHAATAVSLQATANAERATLDGLIQAQVRLAASMAEVKYAAVSVDASVLDLTAGMQGLAIVEALAAQGAIDEAAALAEDATAAAGAALAVESFAAAHSHVVPEVAAASGAIRVFEGNLPIRAVERFAVTTLGLGPILSAAFPIVGAIAFGEMIYKVFSELDPLIAAEKELAEVTKRLDQEYAQLSKEIEHIQIEDLTVKFGKAAGMKIAAFYSATDLAEDQTRIKTLEADIARARAQMASDAASAQTKSNPLVSTLEAFNPLITGERFAANRDYQAQLKKIQEAEDEIGALRLKGQKATRQGELDGDREDKDRRDKALSAAKEAAAAAKAIDDATERNQLASNDRELAAAKEAISARFNLEKIGTEASLALIDDKHTRTILAAANEVAEKVTSEQLLNDAERNGLKTRLAMLDADIAATANHGKAGVAEAIRLNGEKDAASAKYYADVQKRADDLNAALASLGVLEVRENKARLDEQLKDWTENANKEIDVAQKAFEKNKQIDRRVFDSKARETADVERGGLDEQKILLERNYALALDHSAEAQARLGEATLSIDKQILQAQLDRLSKVVENDKATHQADDILARDQETLTRATIQGTLAIEQETTHVKLLEQAANRIHQVFAGLKADFEHAFQSLAHNLSSAIIGAKSFHDAWQHTIRGVAESLLNTLIGAAFGALEHELAKLIARIPLIAAIQKAADHAAAASSLARIATVKAAQTAADAAALAGGLATIAALSAAQATADTARAVSTSAVDVAAVFSLAAVAAAAAFASIAAIPIIGPALAPEAALLAYAEVAAIAPLAAFDKGGWINEDQIAQVHKGEYVLTAEQAKGLQATGTQLPSLPSVHGSNMPSLPNVSSSSSSSIGEVKITVNGAQRPQETAREIARYLKSLSPKFSPAS